MPDVESLMQRIRKAADLRRDIKLLIAGSSTLSFVTGYMQVVQQIYLSILGYDTASIGFLIAVATIMDALRTTVYGALADRYGRKKILSIAYLSNVIYFIIFYYSRDFTWFLAAAMISGGGFTGIGFGGPLEQALIAEKSTNENRTLTFSLQTFSTSALLIVGNFLSGLPEYLQGAYGLDVVGSIRPLFLIGMICCFVGSAIVALIKEEKREKTQSAERRYIPKEIRGIVLKFSIANMIMGFGGGIFLQLLPTWFYLTYNIKLSQIGYIMGISQTVETSAYLISPLIAARTGLVKAYLITRCAGAALMLGLPLMPSATLAALIYSARSAVLHSSIPLKSSYMMALLTPKERAAAAGVINLIGTLPRSGGTSVGGYLMERVSTALPVYVGATMFFIEAFYYYFNFHKIKPPEEKTKDAP